MNFISHFYFDQNKSPEFVLGIAFPDIVGNFSSYYNSLYKGIHAQNELSAEVYDIICGVQQHYRVDGIFHEAPLFDTHCKSLKSIIQESEIQNKLPRLYFVVHVLVELVLDRYLIDYNPPILDEYYQKINAVNESALIEMLSLHDNSERDLPKFLKRFHHFKEFQFLRLYQEDIHLLTAIQKITQHQFSWPLNSEEDKILIECIRTYYNIHKQSEFNCIFEYVIKHLR